MQLSLIVLLTYLGIGTGSTDPCHPEAYLPIPNIGFRYVNYRLNEHDTIFHDFHLQEGWYYVGNVTMPEHPPDNLFTCGTKFPIWLNGTHPTDNIPVTRTACQLGIIKDCDSQYNVRIQRCDGFYVYHLKASRSINVGYCFGEGNKGSAPAYVPSKPFVRTDTEITIFERGNISSAYFWCEFEVSTQHPPLFYVVTWYMNNNQLYMTNYRQDASATALRLTEQKFKSRGFELGSNITCSVRAFLEKESAPGRPSAMADNFFAGIVVLTPNLEFFYNEQDKTKRSIRLRPTVPIGCHGSETCDVRLVAYVPDSSIHGKCTGLAFDQSTCGVKLFNKNYSAISSIPVKPSSDGQYHQTGSFQIFLKTDKTEDNKIWGDYVLPPIKVIINLNSKDNTVYEGQRCSSLNDPHMITFDRRRYDNHQEGEYILYRNTNHNTEVQVKYYNCGQRGPKPIKCNCGIAVRAGQDLFEAHVCQGDIFIGYRFCADKTLEVKSDGTWKYRIFFAYGTYVEVSISGRSMNVHIIPSSHDVHASVGLCGNLDGDPRNDYHYRPGEGDGEENLNEGQPMNIIVTNFLSEFDNQPTKFINVWKVRSDAENLFSPNVDRNIFTPWTFKACVCTNQTYNNNQGSSAVENSIPCTPNGVASCVGGKTIGTHTCSVYKSRRRRSMERNPIIPIVHIDESQIQKRSANDVNMTEDDAKLYCQDQIGSSSVFSLCSNVPSANPNSSLDTCVLDVMLTGSTEWTGDTKESMQDACLSELRRNLTLRETSDNTISIAEQIEELACPNDCSLAGICDKGKCNCEEGLGGSDCSVDITKGPTISGLLDHGMCDEKDLPCDHAYVFGSIFTDNDNLTCRLEEFVISSDGQRQQLQTHYVNGEFETLVETICPLQTTRRKRSLSKTGSDVFVTGYRMSVSNDGNTFEDGKDLFIYDSTCQFVQNTSNTIRFVLKAGFCYLDNACVSNGALHPSDNCSHCDDVIATTTWSTVDTAECRKQSPEEINSEQKPNDTGISTNYLWIIGVVAGVLLGVAVGTVIVIKLTTNRGKKVSDSTVFVPGTQSPKPCST